jgi:hypothetical protein
MFTYDAYVKVKLLSLTYKLDIEWE